MFYKKVIVTAMLSSTLFSVGCSSTVTKKDIAEQEIEIQEMRAVAKEEAANKKQEKMEKEVNLVPAWALDPPRTDETGIYAVGSGSDEDPVTSSRKAMLQAKYELASTLKTELSGEDTMSGSGEQDYRYIINGFVNKVTITGYEIIERKVEPIDGKYKTYVLIKLPFNSLNKVIQEQTVPNEKETLKDSYKRLMSKVKDEPALVKKGVDITAPIKE